MMKISKELRQDISDYYSKYGKNNNCDWSANTAATLILRILEENIDE